MKFNISINQKSAIDSGLPLDVVDLIIIDYSKWWILSRKSEKIIAENAEYTWIDYGSLIKELPILGITGNDAISRRFTKLSKHEILEKYFDKKTSRAFFRFGINYDLLEWDGEGTVGKSEGSGSKVGGGTVGKSEHNITLNNLVLNNILEINKDFPLLSEKLKEFIEYKKQIKHPMKEASFPAFIRKLEKYSGGDEETAIEILENSIANGYQGIFEPKDKKTNGTFNSFSQKQGIARM